MSDILALLGRALGRLYCGGALALPGLFLLGAPPGLPLSALCAAALMALNVALGFGPLGQLLGAQSAVFAASSQSQRGVTLAGDH